MMPIYYLITLALPLATILIVFGMKYISAAVQARAQAAADTAHRELAQQAVAAQAQNATALSAIGGDLAEIKMRLAAVEKGLKEGE